MPEPTICLSCQLAKSKHLSYAINIKCATTVLDLIHCDLWGPAPILSASGYAYYVVFIDDSSRLSWFLSYEIEVKFLCRV